MTATPRQYNSAIQDKFQVKGIVSASYDIPASETRPLIKLLGLKTKAAYVFARTKIGPHHNCADKAGEKPKPERH